jgi:hypothetical protein
MQGNIFQVIMGFFNKPDAPDIQRIRYGIGYAMVTNSGKYRQQRKAKRHMRKASQRRNR